MLRLAQVALGAALVGCVLSAPQSLPGAAESFAPTPELLPVTGTQEHHPGDESVRQGSRTPARHNIEDSSSSVEADDTLSLTYTSAEDTTLSELLPDSLERSATGEEAYGDSAEVNGERERKLSGLLPPDLAEAEGLAKPKVKGEEEIIAEIESILGKVRKQYSKKGQSLPVPEGGGEISSQGQAVQSISDLLKLSASKVDDETVQEDPVIDEARKRYMSIWNQEAERLNAPYMRVTKAWPELGIVYMPVITEVTDQIKASETVKEAAATFKSVWEKRVTETDATNATVEPMLKVLNNFMSAWLWAETADEETAAGVVDDSDHEEQPPKKANVDRSKAEKRLQVQGNPFLENDFMSDLNSQLGELYANIFNTRRPQPSLEPTGVTKSADLIKTLSSGKIMLSCSVVPEADTLADDPINDNIPVNNPVADIRPIIDPFRVLNSIKRPSSTSTRPLRRQTADQDSFKGPVTVNRPFSNPAEVVRQFEDSVAVNRPVSRPTVSPITYAEPFITHEVDIRPITRPEAAAPVARYNYNKGSTADHRYPLVSGEDLHSYESDEVYGRRYASQQPWLQPSWLH